MASSSFPDEETMKNEEGDLQKCLSDLIQGKNTTQSLDFILPVSHQYRKTIGKDAIDALIFYVSSFSQDLENLQKVLSIIKSLIDDDSGDSFSNASYICGKEDSISNIVECFLIPDISTKSQALQIINHLVHLQLDLMQIIFLQNEHFQRVILQIIDDDKLEIQKMFFTFCSTISQNNIEIEKIISLTCLEMLTKCLTSEFPVVPSFLLNIFQINSSFQVLFVESGHINMLLTLLKKRDRNAIDILSILFSSKNSQSYSTYLQDTEVFSLVMDFAISQEILNDRHLFIKMLGDMIRGNESLSSLMSSKLQTIFDNACKFNNQNDREMYACIHFFECYSESMNQELTNFILKISNHIDFHSLFEQNQQKLSLIFRIACICLLSGKDNLSNFFIIHDSECFYTRSISIFSRVTFKMQNLLTFLLMFVSSAIWESKIIAKFTLSKLSSMNRANNQTALYFVTSLSQINTECPIKGISSFILLELLQYLANSKATSANSLKNNVFTYCKQLIALKDWSLFSKFIQKSFESIINGVVNTLTQDEIIKDMTLHEFSKLQQQLDQLNEEYTKTKDKLLKEIEQLKQENDQLINNNHFISNDKLNNNDKLANDDKTKNRDVNNVMNNELLITQKYLDHAYKKIKVLEQVNDQLMKTKTQSDSILSRQIQILKKENQELKLKLQADEEDLSMKRRMESNQIENEKLTKKLESIKQIKKEINSSNEVERLKNELRLSNSKIKEFQDEIEKLKDENLSLSNKESEYLSYRDKLLDAKIQLIALRKENKQLSEKLENIENNISNQQKEELKDQIESGQVDVDENLNQKLVDAKLQIESLKQQISEKDIVNASLKATQISLVNENQIQMNNLKDQLLESNKAIEILNETKTELTAQIDELKIQLNQAFASNQELNTQINEIKNTQFTEKTTTTESEELTEKLKSSQQELDETKIKLNDLQNQINEISTINKSLRKQISEKDLQIMELNSQNESQITETYSNHNVNNELENLKTLLVEKSEIINTKNQELENAYKKIEELQQIHINHESNNILNSQSNNQVSSQINSQPNSPDVQMVKVVRQLAKQKKKNEQLMEQIASVTQILKSKELQVSTLQNQINIFQQLKITESLKDQEIVRLQTQLEEIFAEEEQKENKFNQQNQLLTEKDKQISQLTEEIKKLQMVNQKELDSNGKNNKTNSEPKKEQVIEQNNNQTQTTNESVKNNEIENRSENNDKVSEKMKLKLFEKDQLIENFEAQIAGYKTQVKELESRLLAKDDSPQQNYEIHLKEIEIEKLNDTIFIKDDEIMTLKNEVFYQRKQIADLEKIQSLYDPNLTQTSSNSYETNYDKDMLYQKNREIDKLNLLVSDLQDKISDLTFQLEAEKHNSKVMNKNYISVDDNDIYDNMNSKYSDYNILKQRCELLEKELEQRRQIQLSDIENTQKLKQDMSLVLMKYQKLKNQRNSQTSANQKFVSLKEKYNTLENKHQAALKLIGKLWSRNQTLVYSRGEKLEHFIENNLSPDEYQYF
ncbi:hypothetical protein TRFO_38780 [Tritrichomonas foetus]|uniref:Uncharacterized protein n=1 Tax=Tritrichomonas foetus TaxID=1144522 RepID=A0A1J4J739_9EUKA|nr:hypothetical protein TRFO_38780 [Tritrichomonas foetus]|eukprot:OHS95046.1 hypothetical protein TRFO_38780 [Tritrichomonas foetus]